MIFFLKFVGAYLGYKVSGYLGAICGFILGLSLDAGLSAQIERKRWMKAATARAKSQANEIFFEQTISMLAKLASVDGPITPEETDAFSKTLDRVFNLKPRKKKEALKLFGTAAQSQTAFQIHAAQFHSFFQHQIPVLEGMLDILCALAASDGTINRSEESMIRSASAVFGISDARYIQILSPYVKIERRNGQNGSDAQSINGKAVSASEWPYATLGCAKNDSEAEIKKQYRRLVSEYHPDKILSKELPADFIEFAHKKFRDIQSAYETLKRERGFS